MDPDRTSLELLDHFDRPKLLSPLASAQPMHSQPPALPGVNDTAESLISQEHPAEPGAAASSRIGCSQPHSFRNVRWVLAWAMALATITVAANQLIGFAYLYEAEHALKLAARAGASESMLPRATYKSISAAVERRLTSYPQLKGRLQLTVLQNGRPRSQALRVDENDRISITLSAPALLVAPSWLTKLPFWRGDTLLSARAERKAPSHKLRPEHSQTAAE